MGRSYAQAQKFGVEMSIPVEATFLETGSEQDEHVITLSIGGRVRARTVIVATGARYRRLDVAGIEQFEGTSVHYWASPLEAKMCVGQSIALVGGGNSAGQAAVFLAARAAQVTMLPRRPLRETMSSYLVERILAAPNIRVVEGVEISGFEGSGGSLAGIRWRARSTGAAGGQVAQSARHLFLFIGADPNTDWLQSVGVCLDERGFVRTGPDAGTGLLPLETSRRGVFAIGDVRSGSVKRVAAAAGDGAQVVASVHSYLASLAKSAPAPVMEPAQ
jgi:thioredoxin reductase (NADPH)